MNGWININKPCGVSSMTITSKVKRMFGLKKVGHAGTLDVLASGVLPLAMGEATKLIDFNINQTKEYEFVIQFGRATSTGDAEGDVISETSNIPSLIDAESICEKFIGEIEQVPSIYSAIKINGVRSYKLARKNIPVDIPKRKIHIYELDLIEYDLKNCQAKYRAACSKGTYIRTLAEDISLALQSLGFVIQLVRTRVGSFNIYDSIELSDKLDDCSIKYFKKSIQPVSCVLDDILVIDIDEGLVEKVKNGQSVTLNKESSIAQIIWLRYIDKIIATGVLHGDNFAPKRIFNL